MSKPNMKKTKDRTKLEFDMAFYETFKYYREHPDADAISNFLKNNKDETIKFLNEN